MEIKINKPNLQFIEPLEDLNKIEKLVIHHTSRVSMNVHEAHEFHQKQRGWSGVGYNFFIEKDGSIMEGRGLYVGAHALGYNRETLGICVTGDFEVEEPTLAQMQAVTALCKQFLDDFNLLPSDVIGHKELEKSDTLCPGKNFDMDEFRMSLTDKVELA